MSSSPVQASLPERISEKYESLPKREKLLADAVLECIRDLSGYTATELATRANVSKATATRFFRRLGYNDFEEARLETRRLPYAGSPLEAFYQSSNGNGNAAETHVATELENIGETFRGIAAADIDAAVRLLVWAPRVWVVGFRDNYALAVYASSLLTRILGNVHVLPRFGMSLAEDLSSLDKRDVVLAIGFRRRPQLFLDLLNAVHDREAPVIMLTDAAASFNMARTAVTFRCHIQGSMFDSHIAGLSLINLICSTVGQTLGPVAKARLEAAERLHEEFQDFQPGKPSGTR